MGVALPKAAPEYFREELGASKVDGHSLRDYAGHNVHIYTDGSGGNTPPTHGYAGVDGNGWSTDMDGI